MESVKRAYWDLQVLDTNNYVTADGAIHHNSGKSVACCVEVFRRCCEQKPGPDGIRRSRWAVIRNTYPDLKNTTVKTWQSWFGSEFGQFVNVAPFEHRIRQKLADGTLVEADIIFLAMDKEEDAKKFLSLEVTGIYFNEVRELKRAIIEAGDGRIGRYPSMKDGGPSWYGWIADTNMPDEDHWLYELAEKTKSASWEFYLQPGGVIKRNGVWVPNPDAENLANLVPDYYAGQLEGKTEEWVAVHLGAEYGRIPVEGAYYAEEMAEAERSKRILDLLPDPALPVHTFWDLGVGPHLTYWAGQGAAGQWRWLWFWEGVVGGLPQAAVALKAEVADRKLILGSHVWPHDGTATETGSGQRRCDMWEGLGFSSPIILERTHPGDGIEAARRLIKMSHWDKNACAPGLHHLRRYSRTYNKVRSVYTDTPLHDEHSHGADAWRTAAMGQNKVANAVWATTGKIDYSATNKGII